MQKTNTYPLIIGALTFIIITGGKILNVENTSWLMEGDLATNWLGWMFFRNTPAIQWPLGANPDYGMAIGSSIVFTDSIPLLAIAFKYFDKLLPNHFQYFGIWILTCFIFQSYFSWKILATFTHNNWLKAIGSIFFIITPCFLFRTSVHPSLSAQWLLLAGIYLYLLNQSFFTRWTSLLIITSLVHAYLLFMVLSIWLANITYRAWDRQLNLTSIARHISLTIIAVFVAMWSAGYFMIGSGTSFNESGYGIYRMNLLSPIDPDENWSMLLPDQKQGPGDYEGFNFLGLGILILICFSMYYANLKDIFLISKKIIIIICLCLFLFLFSISNHISIGENEIFNYKIPSNLNFLFNAFRSSGRMFWPVVYIIYIIVFKIIFTKTRTRVALATCTMALSIQIADSSASIKKLNESLNSSRERPTPLASPIWNDVAKNYKNIIFVLPRNQVDLWLPLSYFAANHEMAINIGYFSRTNSQKEKLARREIIESIIKKDLAKDSIYIFENQGILWKLASIQVSEDDFYGIVDNLPIIAKDLKKCSTCNLELMKKSTSDTMSTDYRLDDIDFSSNGPGHNYMLDGWSSAEKWGTWSDADSASLLLEPSKVPSRGILEITINAFPFLEKKHPLQEIEISINNKYIDKIIYSSTNETIKKIKIPSELISDKKGLMLINFKLKNPISPHKLGISPDTRTLGIGLKSIQIKALENDN
jgi:hypothetical protein